MLCLIREEHSEKSVMGKLYHNGGFVCYTLENTETLIPSGMYEISNSRSPRFKRDLPLIYNESVPASRGIRVHAGNTYKDSRGCVLVGMSMNKVKESLLTSLVAERMVMGLVYFDKKMVIL